MTGNLCKGAYVLRFTQEADVQKVMDFCAATRHAGVRARDPDVLKASVSDGSVLVLENPKGGIEGMIAIYPLLERDEKGAERQRWAELGSVRILLNGFPGLFETMIAMSVLRAHFMEPPDEAIIARVGHPSVQQRMAAMGWVSSSPDPQAVVLAARTKRYEDDLPQTAAPAVQSPVWMKVDPEAYSVMAGQLCRMIDDPVLTRADGKMRIGIDFSLEGGSFLFHDHLRALARLGGKASFRSMPGKRKRGLDDNQPIKS